MADTPLGLGFIQQYTGEENFNAIFYEDPDKGIPAIKVEGGNGLRVN